MITQLCRNKHEIPCASLSPLLQMDIRLLHVQLTFLVDSRYPIHEHATGGIPLLQLSHVPNTDGPDSVAKLSSAGCCNFSVFLRLNFWFCCSVTVHTLSEAVFTQEGPSI